MVSVVCVSPGPRPTVVWLLAGGHGNTVYENVLAARILEGRGLTAVLEYLNNIFCNVNNSVC